MRKMIFVLPMLLLLMACGSGGSGRGDEGGVRSLQEGERVQGTIATEGDVDWYSYRVTAPDTLLQISCNSDTLRPDVDLLMSVYDEDEAGEKRRLFATHAPEDAQAPASLQINLFIDEPKEIFIAVRDLQDNEASKDEPYYVRVEEAEADDGNETFAQASQLRVDDETSCHNDSIDKVGDTDCYTFDVNQEGVYVAQVNFNRFSGGTEVNLAVELYDDEGNELARLTQGQGEQYYLQNHLVPGTYFLLIEDQGHDDSDPASNFDVCVASVSVNEQGDNDTRDTADTLTATAPGVYTLEGSLDYNGDADWYRLPIGSTPATGLKILQLSFDNGEDPIAYDYQVIIEDGGDPATALLSHTFGGNGTSAYQTQVKAGEGDHYLRIEAAPGQNANQRAPYVATVTVVDVDDPAEAGAGNNSPQDAIVVSSSLTPVVGKISYRGDDDWYTITIAAADLSTPKVLAVDLTATPGSGQDPHVEYYLSVLRDPMSKKTFDAHGEDGATHLKTSLLVPEATEDATYLIKVSDYQGDEGDEFDYNLLVTVSDIPDVVPAGHGAANYFDETDEANSGTAVEVELEETSLDQPRFNADTQRFDFSNATQTVNGDGTTTLVFPWVDGFIDYQGDQDWFRMQLDKLDPADDDDWYFDVEVQVAASGSSDVEFVWKLYRDRNNNAVLVDRPNANDGYVGAIGDTDPVDTSAYSGDTSTAEGDLWIGDGWGAGDYYISMSDFNYVRIDNGDGTTSENTEPDADWSSTVAYSFQVTLTYHPGVSHPE